jgi:aryl-alcohol dehydrogenase-like predicted oxidoreductase
VSEVNMEQRALGTTGSHVAAIGHGCALFSEGYGSPDDETSLRTLFAAADAGVSLFDTSDVYGNGHNETLLSQFLRTRRKQVCLATKVGLVRKPGDARVTIDNSPRYIHAACDASLRRLQIDTIDLYYLQRRDPEVPLEDTVGAMADLVKAGKVRYLGLSEVSANTLRRAARVHPIAALQSEYSLWTRGPESGELDACRELGVTFVAYCPLGRAFLTGAITDTEKLAANDFRRRMPRFQPDALEKNRQLLPALTTFAAAHGATCAQIALAWLLRKNSFVVPIPGTQQPGHAVQNAAAADIALSPEDIEALDNLFPAPAVVGARLPQPAMAGIETP